MYVGKQDYYYVFFLVKQTWLYLLYHDNIISMILRVSLPTFKTDSIKYVRKYEYIYIVLYVYLFYKTTYY